MEQNILITVIAGTLLFATLSVFILLFVRQYYTAQKKFNWEILQTEVDIREQTLEQISAELHDNIGQMASALKINLNLLNQEATSNHETIEESIRVLKRIIEDIKYLSLNLNTEYIQRIGVLEALKNDINYIGRAKTVQINVHSNIDFKINPNFEIIIYRMCQELLNNIIKHSMAKRASINFKESEDNLEIIIEDDGIGFNINEVMENSHQMYGNGLYNLKRRAKILGGNIEFISKFGQGTKVILTLQCSKIIDRS